MNHCTDQLSSSVLTRTLAKPAIPAAALRFLDLMIGGFESEEVELKVDIPTDWHDQEIQALVFRNEAGRWVELPGKAEREGEKLKLTLPAGRLIHLAVAFIPQGQPEAAQR
jgi:hypothetical protein